MEIYWMLHLSIIFLCHHLSAVTAFVLRTQSTCYNVSNKELHLVCGPEEMIYIHKVSYGHSSTGKCQYTQGDCLIPDQQRYPCQGKRECKINLPSGNTGLKLEACKQYSNYMQVEYACVQGANVHSICSGQETMNFQSGYIKSPQYPLNYPLDVKKCQTRIVAHSSQRIKLYLLDMDMPSPANSCPADLYIKTTMGGQTVCGEKKPRVLLGRAPNEVTVTFEISSAQTHKGFWLYYEAYPPIPSTTPASTLPSSISTSTGSQHAQQKGVPPTHSRDKTADPQQSGSRSKPVKEQRAPIEAIIGTVIGVLFIVVLTLLIIIVIQRRKAARRESQSQMLTSPSFDTSSTTCSTSQVKNELFTNSKLV